MARLRGELARRPGPPGAAAPRVRPGPGVGPAACGLQAKAGRARGRQLAGRSLQTDGQTGEPQLPRGGLQGRLLLHRLLVGPLLGRLDAH